MSQFSPVDVQNLTQGLSADYDIHKSPAVLNQHSIHSAVTKQLVAAARIALRFLDKICSDTGPEKRVRRLSDYADLGWA